MDRVLGNVVPMAVGVALSPMPIVAVVRLIFRLAPPRLVIGHEGGPVA